VFAKKLRKKDDSFEIYILSFMRLGASTDFFSWKFGATRSGTGWGYGPAVQRIAEKGV